ncbi:type II CAAX endopeptidase family protein [Microlunatus speluncae]|uniref:type II CAAX endopeptidase family protein n=1 Tax=Microlunatus speluncae TaxID=2594267 RepID=UPI0012666A1D|nr:type II CAAX endopeptidase family protein [Microlunatus speluncae]
MIISDRTRSVATEPSTAPPGRAPVRRLVQFGVICLVLTWIPWTVLGLTGTDISGGPGQLIFGLAASGPSLAALIMWLRFRRERIRPAAGVAWHRRISGLGLVAGLALGAVPAIVTALLFSGGDLAGIGAHAATVAAGAGGALGVIGYTLIAGPLAEEFGWRGYVQPRLRRSLTRLRTATVLGLGWALWHVPLFLLPGTGQHETGLFTVGAAAFFVSMIPLSYTMIFVVERLRGGVWAAVLAHAGLNAAGALMPSHGDLGAVVELAVTIVVAVIIATLTVRRR